MRYLILSDIHGNWDALESTLRQVRNKRFDATLVLGDLVGYGAAPERVLEQLDRLPGRLYQVRGNHDKLVAGLIEGAEFNELALAAARWTRDHLDRGYLRMLRRLPQGPLVIESEGPLSSSVSQQTPEMAICHGSPVDEDVYLFSEREAWHGFCAAPEAAVTFFGHTHLPTLFVLDGDRVRGLLLRGNRRRLRLAPNLRYLVNPGSVGQPRDRNPRAAYMIYDSKRRVLQWRRVRYPVSLAQERIRKAGLPAPLADRLDYGI